MILLVASKIDLAEQEEVPVKTAATYAKKIGA